MAPDVTVELLGHFWHGSKYLVLFKRGPEIVARRVVTI